MMHVKANRRGKGLRTLIFGSPKVQQTFLSKEIGELVAQF